MKIISDANKSAFNVLKSFRRSGESYRLINYCVELRIDEGVLLLNLLTCELVLLSHEEYGKIYDLDYLKDHLFLIPDSVNEKEYADFVKLYFKTRKRKDSCITTYTIFPTTDCNARCFYCFELGRSRVPMSLETANKVSKYIEAHCGGKPVKFRWFGGEPLMNHEVIDIICSNLRNSGIDIKSGMVSNGFLFDDEVVKKAVEIWNLKTVQITLDGTENNYNHIKAFIYKDCNPYQIVLNNIERLLNASVKVIVRLNMDLHNAEDLLILTQELANRFAGRDKLEVYAHHLFKDGVPMAQMHTEEEWETRDVAMRRIEDTLESAGLTSKDGISKQIRMNHCMADSGSAVTILPDGSIGLCEHHSDSQFIGHIDSEEFDQEMISSWKETMEQIPECENCFFYPECIKLKKCSNASVCYSQYRANMRRKIQRRMRNEYYKWSNCIEVEDTVDIIEKY